MTDNHHRDRALLDDLARTVPQADPAFRDRLETQLLAQLQPRVSDKETDTMQMISTYPRPATQETDRPARRAPLTLAAALLMVMLASSALLFMNRPISAPDSFAAAQQQTATPIPTACPPLLNWTERYTVQPGDTLLGVIVRHGVDARLFLQANCLDENSRLVPGQVVYLPLQTEEPFAVSPIGVMPTPTVIGADAETHDALPPQVVLPPTLEALSTSAAAPEVLVVTVEATLVPPAESYRDVPNGFAPVVIAAQDIAQGTAITADLLAVTYWPLDLYQAAASAAGFDGFYSAVEQTNGLYAAADIPRFQPVQPGDLAAQAAN